MKNTCPKSHIKSAAEFGHKFLSDIWILYLRVTDMVKLKAPILVEKGQKFIDLDQT